jgi:TetR/AcrR family transcriptional repressor of bet genes
VNQALKKPGKTRRALPKEVRREQLVQATMKVISEHGLSGVTMAKVTGAAGLSLGIANLHFESKEKLLLATLEYVTSEYNRGQSNILQDQKLSTLSEKLEALLSFDFSAKIMDKSKLAVWFAFLGEAKSRPTYQRICAPQDTAAEEALTTLFQAAVTEAGYTQVDPNMLAAGYISLVDGLWLNSLLTPRRLGRKKAMRAARQYLASALPQHLNTDN